MIENTNRFLLEPIGIIHTPFHDPEKMPIQFSRSNEVGEIIINPPFVEGLQGLTIFPILFSCIFSIKQIITD
jgi:tRNA (Thr-GGU) A37 N-methylase